ncbi:MAG: hypothetical protein JRJ31_03140 [Deltaproteobacteria bacterium]|nr:hypothetical protein [Deltaproteobacteria bacterium]
MLLEIRDDKIEKEAVWDVGGESPMEIARRLVSLDVKKLICGGIQSDYKEWLIRKGIEVVDNQKGLVKDIVQRVLKVNLKRGGVSHGKES